MTPAAYFSRVPLATSGTPAEVLDFWHDYSDRHVLVSEHDFPRGPTPPGVARAVLQETPHYALSTFFDGMSHQSRRGRAHISRDPEERYFLLAPLSGRARIAQGSVDREIRRGEAYLIPTSVPMEYQALGMTGWILNARASAIDERLRRPYEPVRVDLASAQGGMALDLLRGAVARRGGITGAEFDARVDMVADLLCQAAVGASRPEDDQLPTVLARVRRYLRAHSDNPTLTLQSVAALLHMSDRTLQGILTDSGTNYRELLWTERLFAARRRLGDPRLADLSVDDIARMSGFKSGDTLGKALRRECGMQPGEFRERAQRARAYDEGPLSGLDPERKRCQRLARCLLQRIPQLPCMAPRMATEHAAPLPPGGMRHRAVGQHHQAQIGVVRPPHPHGTGGRAVELHHGRIVGGDVPLLQLTQGVLHNVVQVGGAGRLQSGGGDQQRQGEQDVGTAHERPGVSGGGHARSRGSLGAASGRPISAAPLSGTRPCSRTQGRHARAARPGPEPASSSPIGIRSRSAKRPRHLAHRPFMPSTWRSWRTRAGSAAARSARVRRAGGRRGRGAAAPLGPGPARYRRAWTP